MAFIGTPLDTRNTFQSLVGKRFSGDGSETEFTLDVAPSSTLDIEVFVGNVRQDPNSAYTLSGTTLTFTGAPPSGTNNIYVVHQAKSVGTIDVPALGVSTASIQADAITEAKIADDAVESEHLNNNIISGQTELAEVPASTDEFLISDGGTIKRIDFSHIPVFSKLASTNIVDTQTTTVSFTNVFTSSFRSYFIHVPRVSSRTDGDQIRARLISASGDYTDSHYQTALQGFSSGGNEDRANSDGGDHWIILDTMDSSSSGSHMANFQGFINNPNTTNTSYVQATFNGGFRNDSANEWVGFNSGLNLYNNTAFTGIKFYIDSSSFQNFVGTIYGVNL